MHAPATEGICTYVLMPSVLCAETNGMEGYYLRPFLCLLVFLSGVSGSSTLVTHITTGK
jgi:hypothetical protein